MQTSLAQETGGGLREDEGGKGAGGGGIGVGVVRLNRICEYTELNSTRPVWYNVVGARLRVCVFGIKGNVLWNMQ